MEGVIAASTHQMGGRDQIPASTRPFPDACTGEGGATVLDATAKRFLERIPVHANVHNVNMDTVGGVAPNTGVVSKELKGCNLYRLQKYTFEKMFDGNGANSWQKSLTQCGQLCKCFSDLVAVLSVAGPRPKGHVSRYLS